MQAVIPSTLHPYWAREVFLVIELGSLIAMLVAWKARRLQQALLPSGRRIAAILLSSLVAIAAIIDRTAWSFTGRQVDLYFITVGYISLTALIFGWSPSLPVPWLRWTIHRLIGGIIFAFAAISVIGGGGAAMAERDQIPTLYRQLDARTTYQRTIVLTDHGRYNAAALKFHYHPPGLPILEKEIARFIYDRNQYQLDFLDVTLSSDGQQAVVVRRHPDGSLDTTNVSLR